MSPLGRICPTLVALAVVACAAPPVSPTPPGGASPSAATVAPPVLESPSPSLARSSEFVLGEPLAPGTYASMTFATPLTFTVPQGWKVFEDEPGQFGLARLVNDGPCLCVWRDVRAMSRDCAELPARGVADTASAIAAELASRPGIMASKPRRVTIGGLRGMVIDVSIDPAWTRTCPFSQGRPAVPMIVGSGLSTGVAWDVEPNDPQRLYLLALPGATGSNIVIDADACCGVGRAEQVAAADEVVASFEFGDQP
jgi:hypothetical protein